MTGNKIVGTNLAFSLVTDDFNRAPGKMTKNQKTKKGECTMNFKELLKQKMPISNS